MPHFGHDTGIVSCGGLSADWARMFSQAMEAAVKEVKMMTRRDRMGDSSGLERLKVRVLSSSSTVSSRSHDFTGTRIDHR